MKPTGLGLVDGPIACGSEGVSSGTVGDCKSGRQVFVLWYCHCTEFVLRCVWAAGEWSEGARMRTCVQSYTYTAIKVPRNGNKVPRDLSVQP